VTHPSAVTSDLQHAIPLLHAGRGWKLTTLFGPEHGMWGEAQDMAHVTDAVDPLTGLRVYSLYGASEKDLAPRSEMLKNIDALVIDLQDIGSRYYTFIYTMALCMRQAAGVGLPVIVLDRPNPIDGVHLEGNIREEKYSSFVGMFALPTRHGMTAGELARYFNKTFNLNCDLTVIPMRGWKRSMWWGDTGLPWVIPSPNMPTVFTAAVYPGMCLIEGTNLSEGRGTTHPFEFFGAPWLNPFKLADELNHLDLPGVRFRPHYFLPTFQKHAGKVCGGVEMHVPGMAEHFLARMRGLWLSYPDGSVVTARAIEAPTPPLPSTTSEAGGPSRGSATRRSTLTESDRILNSGPLMRPNPPESGMRPGDEPLHRTDCGWIT
jgi:uncharacterized protein YbbC (DUF1343 family)